MRELPENQRALNLRPQLSRVLIWHNNKDMLKRKSAIETVGKRPQAPQASQAQSSSAELSLELKASRLSWVSINGVRTDYGVIFTALDGNGAL
uniref:Uncharacterized protein n=1 Tax=Tetranychus urticae TaxID=32264 RepID=T1JSF2_TETUR